MALNPEEKKDFLLYAYKSMRDELNTHVAFRRQVETQTGVGTAAIFAWALSNSGGLWVASVAPLLAAYGGWRWYQVNDKIGTHVRYMERAENQFLGELSEEEISQPGTSLSADRGLGPQQHFLVDGRGNSERENGLLLAIGFGAAVLIATVAVLAFGLAYFPNRP